MTVTTTTPRSVIPFTRVDDLVDHLRDTTRPTWVCAGTGIGSSVVLREAGYAWEADPNSERHGLVRYARYLLSLGEVPADVDLVVMASCSQSDEQDAYLRKSPSTCWSAVAGSRYAIGVLPSTYSGLMLRIVLVVARVSSSPERRCTTVRSRAAKPKSTSGLDSTRRRDV